MITGVVEYVEPHATNSVIHPTIGSVTGLENYNKLFFFYFPLTFELLSDLTLLLRTCLIQGKKLWNMFSTISVKERRHVQKTAPHVTANAQVQRLCGPGTPFQDTLCPTPHHLRPPFVLS